MTRVMWMAALAVAGWLVVAWLTDRQTSVDAGWGIAGSLVAASVSWMVMERSYRRNPARLTAVMAQSLLVKLVFFAAYAALGAVALGLRPTVFLSSLGASYLAFHVVETMWLRRLLAGAWSSASH